MITQEGVEPPPNPFIRNVFVKNFFRKLGGMNAA